MENTSESPAEPHNQPTAPDAGRFAWPALAIWAPGCLVAAVLSAWVADVVQSDLKFAPLILFPVLVGLGVAGLLVAAMRVGQVAHRPTILIGTVLAGLATVAGQHYFAYRAEVRRAEAQIEKLPPQAQFAAMKLIDSERLGGPWEYLCKTAARGRPIGGSLVLEGWLAWLSWGIDGLIVLAAALGVVIPTMRLPFCNRCGRWYRTVRNGRIDAATAGRLAELADTEPPAQSKSARYRLSSCAGGCGPTRFELSWEVAEAETDLTRVWIDAGTRGRIVQVLDELPDDS
jgi:hypothetical protein